MPPVVSPLGDVGGIIEVGEDVSVGVEVEDTRVLLVVNEWVDETTLALLVVEVCTFWRLRVLREVILK